MAWKDLIHPKMGNPVKVAYGSTVGIVTCTGDKRIYIDGVYVHAGYGASTSAQLYFVPNGGTTDSPDYRIVDESIADRGSYTFQVYASPLVLENTGDALFVGTGDFESTGAGATCTFMISGYRES
jgi:hypothetical protein|tara:strand:+ start:524 stop:898 length:375 start_codon:yes stop_codon:yes gene_type:complete